MAGPESLTKIQWSTDTVTSMSRKRPANRKKFMDNGYMFTWDKDSVNGERSFWRCEKKGECPARIHTDPVTGTVLKRLHYHTHPCVPDPNVVHLTKRAKFSTICALGDTLRLTEMDGTLLDETASLVESPVRGVDKLLDAINGVVKSEMNDDQAEKIEENNEVAVENYCDTALSTTIVHDVSAAGTSFDSIPQSAEIPSTLDAEFWSAFELTKQIIAIVRKRNNEKLNGPVAYHSTEVKRFVRVYRFMNFVHVLSKFSMDELLRLSVEECQKVIDDVPEGIRLYHAIRSFWDGEGKSSNVPIRLFVCPEDDEPIYQMVQLQRKTVEELRKGLVKRKIVEEDSDCRLCIHEGKIVAELCDEMMASWASERVFTFEKKSSIIILKPAENGNLTTK